jgi:hypothetical protein
VAVIADELRARLRASPFKPFTVITAAGTRVHVHHHDYAWVLPTGGEFYVQDLEGKVHWIYTHQIAELVHEETAEEKEAA